MHPRPCRFAQGWSAGAVMHDGSHGEGTHSPALSGPAETKHLLRGRDHILKAW